MATLPVAFALMWAGPLYHMLAVLLLFPVALMAAQTYEHVHGVHDAKAIVIDEVLGFLITMTWLPLTWQSFVLGLVLFRILDIWKPFPISALDHKVKGGLGVILDDIAAGFVANMALQWLAVNTEWLGYRVLVV